MCELVVEQCFAILSVSCKFIRLYGLLLGLITLPEWAGDSRNSTQSPASRPGRCPGDDDLPECTELVVILWQNIEILKCWTVGIVNEMGCDTLT